MHYLDGEPKDIKDDDEDEDEDEDEGGNGDDDDNEYFVNSRDSPATPSGRTEPRFMHVKRGKNSNEKGKRTEKGMSLFLGPNGHSEEVDSLVFSRDKTKLFSGSRDYTIKIWDIKGKVRPWLGRRRSRQQRRYIRNYRLWTLRPVRKRALSARRFATRTLSPL